MGDQLILCGQRKVKKTGAVVVAQLVEQLFPNTRGPRFEYSHLQNLYRTFVYCQLN